MELALYHPDYGYYSSNRAAVGRHGDYFTNVSVGPVFGQLLASQFVEIWKALGKPSDFVVVEQGAHHGAFARDLLQALRLRAPEFLSRLRYRIVEPFARLQDRQRETLSEFAAQIDWAASIDALPSFRGIHFSNELFDALPVHLISAQSDRNDATPLPWMERRVGLAQDSFVFIDEPIIEPSLRERVQRLPVHAAPYQTEINLTALPLIRDLSRKLTDGYMIAVDYGFSKSEFYAEQRSTGTLQCRAQHRLLDSPFTDVGEADISAHVEWTSLVEEAGSSGFFALAGFTDQHHFLTGLLAATPDIAQQGSSKTRRALQTLLHPEMLGRSFQVLALARNMETSIALSGFKFARDARQALDL